VSQPKQAKIELFKEAMKFSAGHFTIFSATERENLHGHNFTVHVEFTAPVTENGMTVDYRKTRQKLIDLCQSLNEIVLLPTQSPHLRIQTDDKRVTAYFADEELIFLKRDVMLLPLRNITIEELASYLLDILVAEMANESERRVTAIAVRVFSGPGQSARVRWMLS